MFDIFNYYAILFKMKQDLLFNILLCLSTKTIIPAKELSIEFNISTRSVYRYISILDSSNIPIISKVGKNGGFSLLKPLRLNNLFFTLDEKLELAHLIDKALLTLNNSSLKAKLKFIQTDLLNFNG